MGSWREEKKIVRFLFIPIFFHIRCRHRNTTLNVLWLLPSPSEVMMVMCSHVRATRIFFSFLYNFHVYGVRTYFGFFLRL